MFELAKRVSNKMVESEISRNFKVKLFGLFSVEIFVFKDGDKTPSVEVGVIYFWLVEIVDIVFNWLELVEFSTREDLSDTPKRAGGF